MLSRKVAALFAAREGSKRIPGKALKRFCGQPIIEYVVDKYSHKCELIDDYFFSTSSKVMKDLLKDRVTIIDRPKSLDKDNVVNLLIYQHAVKVMQEKYGYTDNDIMIYIDYTKPLTPVHRLYDLISGMNEGWSAILPVKRIKRNLIDDKPSLTQNAKERYYHWNGFRIFTMKALKDGDIKSDNEIRQWGAGDKSGMFKGIEDWEIDIDTPEDWIMAEALAKAGY